MRQLGVQMVRIREGLQNQATQNHATPAHKARAVKELSQADRIAQLELELAQRDAKEEKLAQQVAAMEARATRLGLKGKPGSTHRSATRYCLKLTLSQDSNGEVHFRDVLDALIARFVA